MKKNSIVAILLLTLLLSACNNGETISSRSPTSMFKSVVFIKNRLPEEQRVEFEVAFATIRSDSKSSKELLDKVGGKKPDEIIPMAKEIFAQRKNAGQKEYQEFTTWEQMIAKFSQERIDQNKHKRPDPREKSNNNLNSKI